MSDLLRALANFRAPHTLEIRKVASPAAGAEIVVPVPGGEDWRILAIRATFTTSAVVANRNPTLAIDNQTDVGGQSAAGVAIVASTTTIVNFLADGSAPATALGSGVAAVIIPAWIAPTGWRFRTITGAIDVGDQWSAITVMLERLDAPPFVMPMTGTAFEEEIHHDLEAMRQESQS